MSEDKLDEKPDRIEVPELLRYKGEALMARKGELQAKLALLDRDLQQVSKEFSDHIVGIYAKLGADASYALNLADWVLTKQKAA